MTEKTLLDKDTAGTSQIGRMSVYKEFKPLRDAIEVTVFFRRNGRKHRLDLEFHYIDIENLSGGDFRRYVIYEIEKAVREDEEF